MAQKDIRRTRDLLRLFYFFSITGSSKVARELLINKKNKYTTFRKSGNLIYAAFFPSSPRTSFQNDKTKYYVFSTSFSQSQVIVSLQDFICKLLSPQDVKYRVSTCVFYLIQFFFLINFTDSDRVKAHSEE